MNTAENITSAWDAILTVEGSHCTPYATRLQAKLTALTLVLTRALERTALRRSDRENKTYTLDIIGPRIVGFEKSGARCICEADARCVAVWRWRETGEALPADGDEEHRALFAHVAYIEEGCPAVVHYSRLEVEEGTPTTSADEKKQAEDREVFEYGEWLRHRAPLVSSRSHDGARGYAENPFWVASQETEDREAKTEAKLYARLRRLRAEGKPSHPWLDPRRGAGHGRTRGTKVYRSGEEVRDVYYSTFVQLKRAEDRLRFQHDQKRRIAALVEALGLSIRDDRVRARIAALGLDAAEEALEVAALEKGVLA